MKKETIKKRLDKIQNVSKTSSAYKLLKKWLESDENYIIRPCWISGAGRFATNLDYTEKLSHLLKLLRVKHEVGNDAPRGGKTGNFIRIIL